MIEDKHSFKNRAHYSSKIQVWIFNDLWVHIDHEAYMKLIDIENDALYEDDVEKKVKKKKKKRRKSKQDQAN